MPKPFFASSWMSSPWPFQSCWLFCCRRFRSDLASYRLRRPLQLHGSSKRQVWTFCKVSSLSDYEILWRYSSWASWHTHLANMRAPKNALKWILFEASKQALQMMRCRGAPASFVNMLHNREEAARLKLKYCMNEYVWVQNQQESGSHQLNKKDPYSGCLWTEARLDTAAWARQNLTHNLCKLFFLTECWVTDA